MLKGGIIDPLCDLGVCEQDVSVLLQVDEARDRVWKIISSLHEGEHNTTRHRGSKRKVKEKR